MGALVLALPIAVPFVIACLVVWRRRRARVTSSGRAVRVAAFDDFASGLCIYIGEDGAVQVHRPGSPCSDRNTLGWIDARAAKALVDEHLDLVEKRQLDAYLDEANDPFSPDRLGGGAA